MHIRPQKQRAHRVVQTDRRFKGHDVFKRNIGKARQNQAVRFVQRRDVEGNIVAPFKIIHDPGHDLISQIHFPRT